jgi:hypothetical protein
MAQTSSLMTASVLSCVHSQPLTGLQKWASLGLFPLQGYFFSTLDFSSTGQGLELQLTEMGHSTGPRWHLFPALACTNTDVREHMQMCAGSNPNDTNTGHVA